MPVCRLQNGLQVGYLSGKHVLSDRLLEAPEFDDALDDDAPDNAEGDESGRAPSGGQGDDEATAGENAGMTEEPDAEAADALFSVAVPDR